MDENIRIVKIGGSYYYFPAGINDIDGFVSFINHTESRFIKMIRLDEEHCVFPYFIAEETAEVYLNVACCAFFEEKEATVLSKKEYEERLRRLVKTKCVSCENYVDDESLEGHYERLCLNGFCWGYSEKKE